MKKNKIAPTKQQLIRRILKKKQKKVGKACSGCKPCHVICRTMCSR